MFEWLSDNWAGIAICCFLVSEILPFIKSVKANGLTEAIFNLFKRLSERA